MTDPQEDRPGRWLDGTVALVTGGGGGIGRAVVRRFVAEGARVGVLERRADLAEALAGELGDRVAVTVGDVTSPADNRRAVAAVLERFGRLDCFVGNAGLFDYFRPLSTLPPEELAQGFDELFAVNVKGYLIGARCALDALRQSRGSMIFTVSNSGLYAGGGGALYVSSKHAVVGLIRQLAYELAPDIRVNGVAPGGTSTALSGPAALGQQDRRLDAMAGLGRAMETGTPLGFLAEPEDHAGIYVLLASRANSRATTGAVIPSDGGLEVRGRPPRKQETAS